MFPTGSNVMCRVLYRWVGEDSWEEIRYVTGVEGGGSEQAIIVGCGAMFLQGVGYDDEMEIVFEVLVDDEWQLVVMWRGAEEDEGEEDEEDDE